MKFYEGVGGGTTNKWLNCGGSLDYYADCPIGNPAITQQNISGFWRNFQDISAMR